LVCTSHYKYHRCWVKVMINNWRISNFSLIGGDLNSSMALLVYVADSFDFLGNILVLLKWNVLGVRGFEYETNFIVPWFKKEWANFHLLSNIYIYIYIYINDLEIVKLSLNSCNSFDLYVNMWLTDGSVCSFWPLCIILNVKLRF
jgi:hypothetical protein